MAIPILSPAPAFALSRELQLGKAAEHLVCADLILQGFNAFLADQGLPYDLVVEGEGRFYRVQVRSTQRPLTLHRRTRSGAEWSHTLYRWGFRRGGTTARDGGNRRYAVGSLDVFAFVALDVRKIAYFRAEHLTREDGNFVSIMELRADHLPSAGRSYSSGKTRSLSWSRLIEDYASFSTALTVDFAAQRDAERKCSNCGQLLPADTDHFYPSKSGRFGLDSMCRVCNKARSVAYQRRRREAAHAL